MSDALRTAFLAGLSRAPGPGCPPAEELWALVRGDLPPAVRAERVRHTATCGPCAAALGIAVDLGHGLEPRVLRPPPSRWRAGRLALVGAAAAVLVGALLPVALRRGTPEIHERGVVAVPIRSLLPPGPRRRSALTLAWTAPPRALRYQVTLATADLEVLFEKHGLLETQVVVPESALTRVPAGARLVWRVEAVLADGQVTSSPAFELSLQ